MAFSSFRGASGASFCPSKSADEQAQTPTKPKVN